MDPRRESRQKRAGRRGACFTVRLTDDERAALEAAHRASAGPRALGPWMVWRALDGAASSMAENGQGSAPPGGEPLGGSAAAGELAAAAAGSALAIARRRGVLRTRAAEPPPRGIAAPPPKHERLILDLCAGSGAWSEPYARAGYRVRRVTLPADDVRTFAIDPAVRVWGILAAPPCDQFSLARNGVEAPRDILRGMETVAACMRLVLQARPAWWAVENPVGLLARYLGTPADVFEPCDFGDPWTKRTALWGEFVRPRRGPYVRPLGGGPLCTACDPTKRATSWCRNAAHRAKTPEGFARAFFEANP